MYDELAQVFVASFADPEQPWLPTGRILSRYQTEPSGEIAPTRKRRSIANRGRQGGRIQCADPRDRGQAPSCIVSLRADGELLIKCFDATVDPPAIPLPYP